MRKTNSNIKRAKYVKRIALSFALGQLIILLFFILGIYESMPIDAENCTNAEIVVLDKAYVRKLGESQCVLTSNDAKYTLPNLGVLNDYTGRETYETLSKGQSINIMYIHRYGVFGKYNLILDARDDSNVYLDFDTYNSSKRSAFGGVLILFSIIELLWVLILIVRFILARMDLNKHH